MATLRDLERDAYAWVNSAARNAAKEIMNGLAEAGPNWSGEFQDSWVAHAPGAGSGSGAYPYTLSDIPKLPPTKKEAARKTGLANKGKKRGPRSEETKRKIAESQRKRHALKRYK